MLFKGKPVPFLPSFHTAWKVDVVAGAQAATLSSEAETLCWGKQKKAAPGDHTGTRVALNCVTADYD